jgi:predicted aldo/keto reductase-like oxidoreductase
MIYREYGRTGKKISLLGFGGLRFKEEDTLDEAGIERCVELVKYASSKGINYFDTAPNYSNSKSEIIFGMAFKELSIPFYISTKSTILAEKNSDAVRWRIETSLKRLGLEKIHFFNMWAIIDMEQYRLIMAKGGPYEGALKAKEEGLVEHIVFSTHCTGDEVAQIVSEGYFEGVTIGYNALNYIYRRKGLTAAYKKGLGVVTMNPLNGGLIPQNLKFFEYLKENSQEDPITSALRFNACAIWNEK